MAVVYKHIRKNTNEVFYIGIGKTIKRAHSKSDRTKYWYNIIKDGYDVEIMFSDLTWEDALVKEKELIKFYGRKDLGLGPLVNLTDGGEGSLNRKLSLESRKKISVANKGKKLSEETKLKISNTEKGRIFSEETRKKISESKKKYIMTDLHKKNMSESRKRNGTKPPSRKGCIPWNKGLKKNDKIVEY